MPARLVLHIDERFSHTVNLLILLKRNIVTSLSYRRNIRTIFNILEGIALAIYIIAYKLRSYPVNMKY